MTDQTHDQATIFQHVGNTPLLSLRAVAPDLPPTVALYGKAEWMNPGGSVKDRAALGMIRDGERRGVLRPGMRIADATSGNTGIAYATLGAALGYGVTVAMPDNASPERIQTLQILGAEVLLTPADAGMDWAMDTIQQLVHDQPDQYFYPDQYNNPANAQAHEDTTAPEIWRQTSGQVTHFVAGLGTCGTFTGTGRGLRRAYSGIQLIGVQPTSGDHGIEGIKHLATTTRIPGIYDPQLADATIAVETEAAYAMARQLARTTGWLVGISAAANVAAAVTVARQLTHGTVVTILCDSAARYLSAPFWQDA